MSGIKIEDFSTTTVDNVVLRGKLIIPDNPKAVVQFNGGAGAAKEFYQSFLEFLASEGYLCCLWDYRGSGASAPEQLKGCEYTFRDYGLYDMPAIKEFLTASYPDLPFFFVVHSVGGQQLGLVKELDDVKGLVSFAVSTGYLPFMPLGYRILSFYFFYIFTPLSNLLAGYVKAKPFGYMENLPKNVVLEWRDWCSKKGYLFDPKFYGKTVPVGHYKQMPFPIHVFTTSDDTISSRKNIENFWSHVESKHSIEFTHLSPQQFEEKAIGHMGFFRKRFRKNIWVSALEKLEEFYKRAEYP